MVSIRSINRRRTVALYCMLVDKYGKFCDVSRTYKSEGKRALADEKAYDSFMNYVEPAVERFCGDFYRFGANPDALPHPLRIAICVKQGMTNVVEDALKQIGKVHYLPKVISMMHDFGMIEDEQ